MFTSINIISKKFVPAFALLLFAGIVSAKPMERRFDIVSDPKTGETKQVYITGTQIKKNSAGVIVKTMSFKDGWLDGPTITYSPDGKISQEQNYTKGKLNGIQNTYQSDGKLRLAVNYLDDRKHGEEFIYTYKEDKRILSAKGNYNLGLKSGEQIRYHSNGQKKDVINYQVDTKSNRSILQGVSIEYNKEGVVTRRAFYTNGKLHGLSMDYLDTGEVKRQTCYVQGAAQKGTSACGGGGNTLETVVVKYDNGNKKMEYQVKNGKLNGFRKQYSAEGTLISSENYVNDNKHGSEKHFYENGTLNAEMTWKDGLRQGWEKHYYMNGKVREAKQYKNDKLHGKYTTYFDNGNERSVSHYRDDLRHGIYTSKDYDGIQRVKDTYDNGQIVHSIIYYRNGNKYLELLYKNGTIAKSKNWNKEGKLISEAEHHEDGSQKVM